MINVYELIEGLTLKKIDTFSINDQKLIMNFLTDAFDSIYKLIKIRDLPYKKEAMTDLKAAVDNILTENTNYGFSKWSSLQFIEKILKGLLEKNNVIFPKTHDLEKLNKLLINNKLPNVPKSVLDKIKCGAEVRYNVQIVTRKDAVDAHHASVQALKYLFQDPFSHVRKNY